MAMPNTTRDEVRAVLAAAADVIFSDGVSEAFLDQWTDETTFMLASRHDHDLATAADGQLRLATRSAR